jgi:hypothetical protein
MEQKWRPTPRPQDIRVGRYFMLSDFLYSEDAIIKGIPNCPVALDGMEVQGIRGLCEHILDPVVDKFGPLTITFGYVSPTLWRKWNGQNALIEGLHVFRPTQGGSGGACDILVHRHEDNPRPVYNWIRDNCIYDRLIIFPGSKILCVGWTEIEPRKIANEWVFDEMSRRHYVPAGREEPPAPPQKKQRFGQGRLFFRWLLSLAAILVENNQK